LSTIDPIFSDEPACDVEEEQEDLVNKEFWVAWIDLEKDIDRIANMGMALDQEEELEDVLGVIVHFNDPLPSMDFGVGPQKQIDPDIETMPTNDRSS